MEPRMRYGMPDQRREDLEYLTKAIREKSIDQRLDDIQDVLLAIDKRLKWIEEALGKWDE